MVFSPASCRVASSWNVPLTSVHPGVTVDKVVKATGWPLKVAADVTTSEPPTETELNVLRDLNERTARAHAGQA